MGITQIETSKGILINVDTYKECKSIRGLKSLCINNNYILKKRDWIIYICDATGEKCRGQFRFKDKWFQDKIYSIEYQTKQTNLRHYGVENPYQSKKIQEKIKSTNIKRYGVDNPLKNDEIKDRVKQTQIKKYGCLGFNTDKQKQTLEKRYGDRIMFKTSYFKEKVQSTWLENYGVNNPGKSKQIRKKMSDTMQDRYGVAWYVETDDFKKQAYKTKKKNGTLYRSKVEYKIENFIKSFNIKTKSSVRDIIYPYELDLYIPEYKLAIECNGLYWHSEQLGIDKQYHLNKTNLCEKQGIQLIHIFEDEWVYKQEIVLARLKHILKLNNTIIGARKTIIKEINSQIKNDFLNTHHIQGTDKSAVKLGAFYNDTLIAVMTFSKARKFMNKKHREGLWELSRYASAFNISTPGLAHKMLNYFKRNYEWDEIYSYADRRWSQGNLYKQLGFEFDSYTNPNYFYFNGKEIKRFHRFGFRKDQLKEFENYSPEKTEHQIMDEAGWFRIWDSGNIKFKLMNKY